MALWMVRAGRHGQQEDLALDQGLVAIGWDDMPDLSKPDTKEELRAVCEELYPEEPVGRISNWLGQLWGFARGIEVGDLVALPLKSRPAVAVGKCTGPYEPRPEGPEGAKHVRSVKWLRKDVPRSEIGQDLLYSLGSLMTVCQVTRNDAEARFQHIVETGRDPNLFPRGTVVPAVKDPSDEDTGTVADLEVLALDQIRAHIAARFKGHGLARLVAAVLRAQGYHAFASPAGPDGGVDIVAGGGPMGFDQPRLCVQVKSGASPVDVSVLRELQGVMKNFAAEQGLLVSWGGFKDSVHREGRRVFFEIRLWDSDRLIDALLANYEKLPEDMQAELPLKRIWTLVLEE